MDRGHHNDRIIFNGNDLSNLVMCRFERPLMPPIENEHEAISGRHGELFKRTRMAAYTQPVTIWLREEDRHEIAAIRRKVAALLYTDKPAPLYLPDEPDKYYMAIVDGDTSLGDIVNGIPETTVNFLICDPVAYGKKRSVGIASGVSKRIDVGGTWKTYPTITIQPTSTTSASVTNVATGEYIEINATSAGGSLSTAKKYIIDTETEHVTLDGNTVGVTPASDFFTIEGASVIRTLGCEAQVDWRERWL